jgi:hypothetical protein
VYATGEYGVPRTTIRSVVADSGRYVYLAGSASSSGSSPCEDYVVRKYDPYMEEYQWQRRFGIRGITDPCISTVVGMQSGNVLVAGYTDGLFKEKKYPREVVSVTNNRSYESDSGLIRIRITLLLSDGREGMTWQKTLTLPGRF